MRREIKRREEDNRRVREERQGVEKGRDEFEYRLIEN